MDNRNVAEKKFRVKNNSNPVAVFAGQYGGEVTKDIALYNEVLNVEVKDFLWDLKFETESFKLLVTKDKMKSMIANCSE